MNYEQKFDALVEQSKDLNNTNTKMFDLITNEFASFSRDLIGNQQCAEYIKQMISLAIRKHNEVVFLALGNVLLNFNVRNPEFGSILKHFLLEGSSSCVHFFYVMISIYSSILCPSTIDVDITPYQLSYSDLVKSSEASDDARMHKAVVDIQRFVVDGVIPPKFETPEVADDWKNFLASLGNDISQVKSAKK